MPHDTLDTTSLHRMYSTLSSISHFLWSVACEDCRYHGQVFVSRLR